MLGSSVLEKMMLTSLTYAILFTSTLAWNQAGVMMMQSQSRDYCEAETFHANCNSDQVVLMTEALYGRMEVGRCVAKDYGYVGCQVDVMDHMDNTCSGRRSCEIRIPDASLDRAKTGSNCPSDFKTYLKAAYDCVPVHNPPCKPCRNHTEILAGSREGYLGSIVTEESGCGNDQCPFLVKAQTGQTLNLTLLDFGLPTKRVAPASNSLGLPVACMMYAIVNERVKQKDGKVKDRELKVCAGNQRETNIFISESHAVTVKMFARNHGSSSLGQFMIKYEVMGCADYDAPRNTWVKRSGDAMEIGCVSTGEKWDMTCIEGEWAGEIGVCPPAPPASSAVRSSHILSIPMGILIAVILAIAMIIGVVILTAGLIVIKRRRQRAAALRQAEMMHQEQYMKGMYGAPLDLQKSYIGDKTIGRYQHMQHSFHEPQFQPPNGFLRNPNTEMRPLPSIPDIPSALEQERRQQNGDPMTRSATGDNLMSQSVRSNDSYRPRHSSVDQYSPRGDDSSVSRQYFVLDPEVDPMLQGHTQGHVPDERYGEGPVSPAESQDNFVRGLCQPGTICNHNPSCFATNHVALLNGGVHDSSKYSWP